MNLKIEEYKTANISAINSLDNKLIVNFNEVIKSALDSDNVIYLAGNGGSFSTASHAVCDFTKGINTNRGSKLRVHCLLDSIPLLTAWSNDLDYIFAVAKALSVYQRPKDILFIISGSGNSENLIEAAKESKRVGNKVVSLTGFNGGNIKTLSDFNINVSSNNMQVIENIHLLLIHVIFKLQE